MSIKSRIEDADSLFQHGRKEGSLLLVLIAVAATSRKRYPKERYRDSEAFKAFVCEEMVQFAPGWKKNSNVEVNFRGEPLRMPDVLYEYVRCNLFHEAELPIDISLKDEEGFSITVINNERLVISDKIFWYLKKIVIEAPENANVFQA